MSSSIVIPSLHPVSAAKKEFLIYEASISDIVGIMVFNYFIAAEIMTGRSLGVFGGTIVISIVLSLLFSFILLLILAKTKLNIKFFLIFSLLVLIYAGGKIFHLPSLIIILVFGLMINNWENAGEKTGEIFSSRKSGIHSSPLAFYHGRIFFSCPDFLFHPVRVFNTSGFYWGK